jgi:thiamine-monophosphate kinase
MNEFELIQRFFTHTGSERSDVILSVGDDCALLRVPEGKELAVTIDTLVEGVHFLPGTDPQSLGHKALAVNLSDLAAMGAEPAWVTLALTLPSVDESWLAAFCRGFSALAEAHGVQLIGGDTTRGPLAISVQAQGFTESGQALRRSGAKAGDLIYVTGTLGDAGLALLAHHGTSVDPEHLPYLQSRLDRPTPRIDVGGMLPGLASAAIDISDGLLADLGHICEASEVGAKLELAALPCSPGVRRYVDQSDDWGVVLSSGDDYELCFTVPPEHQADVEVLVEKFECGLSRIGVIEQQPGLRCMGEDGSLFSGASLGYEHFSTDD